MCACPCVCLPQGVCLSAVIARRSWWTVKALAASTTGASRKPSQTVPAWCATVCQNINAQGEGWLCCRACAGTLLGHQHKACAGTLLGRQYKTCAGTLLGHQHKTCACARAALKGEGGELSRVVCVDVRLLLMLLLHVLCTSYGLLLGLGRHWLCTGEGATGLRGLKIAHGSVSVHACLLL